MSKQCKQLVNEKNHFVFLMPHVLNERGHGLIYHQTLEGILKELNVGSIVGLLPQDAKFSSPLPANFSSFFKRSSNKVLQVVFRIRDLSRAFRTFSKHEKTIFYVDTFNTIDFIALWISSFFSLAKKDRLWLMFRYGKSSNLAKLITQKIVLKLFSLSKNIVFLTDSSLIADELREECHKESITLPIPHTDKLEEVALDDKKSVNFWWPGEPRIPKGLYQMQRLSQLLEDQTSVNLFLSKETPLSAKNENIKYISSHLSREEYREMMLLSDVVLLPYDPLVYRVSTSGILVETIIAGKIPVVREGSWLANELKQFGLQELIIDWDDCNCVSNILKLIKDQTVLEKLATMRKSYENFHTQGTYKKIVADCMKY